MATLEVHDGKGRVEYVTISRKHPALIGTDPKCDVVVSDPSALPFHGRLRWKTDRFKVEAFPEARALDVNGKKVVSSSFRQGDELAIGNYRLFLTDDSDTGDGDLQPTTVQSRPASAGAGGGSGGGGGWLDAPNPTLPASQPTAARKPAAAQAKAAAPVQPAIKVVWWKRALRSLNAGGAPGENDNVASSPLVLGLVVTLCTLLLIGYGLWSVITRNRADNQFNRASQLLADRDYTNSEKAFDVFLETNPRDSRAGRARVLRALSKVRQFSSAGGQSWTSVIINARQMIKAVGKDPYFREKRMDLAEDILKAADGFAILATRTASAEDLARAHDALKLHEQVTGDAPHNQILSKSKVPAHLAEAQAAVTKAQVRRDLIASMKKSVKEGDADAVYATRDELVNRYPDLANDSELVTQLTEANEIIRKSIRFDTSRRPAETTPQPDPLGPPVSVVLRQVPPGARPVPPSPDGEIVYAVAQGYVYGIDGSNGAPVWHVPVGLNTRFAPVGISGANPALIMFDSRHDELIKLDGRTGNLLWRQSTEEPITSPPLILGRQVLQVVPSGKLLLIDLESGELKGSLVIDRPLAGTPATDEAGQYFYLTGDRDVLYVVSRDPFECIDVEYLGHPSGSIACAPARLANFLIVPENRELWEGRWSIFVIEQDGEKLRFVQSVKIPGWTWQTPPSQGTIVWSLTDRGALTAFVMGSDDSPEPLTRVASTVPDARPSGPAYAHVKGDHEIWISSSRLGRFDLEAELGSLSPTWTIERAGQSAGPIQTAGRLAILQHQFEEGPGITLWGLDPSSGSVRWKTVLGAPWPLDPSPSPDGQRLTTLASDGPEVEITPNLLASGGFLEWPLRRPGYFSLPKGPLQRLQRPDLTVLVPSPDADHLLVREDASSEFRRVDLPAPLGATPVFWGPDLFVPGLDGRAYLVNPSTGAAEAEPYVPAFDTEAPTRWRAPVFLNEAVVLANQAGQVRRLARVTEPRLRLDVVGDVVDLKSTLESDPATTTDAVIVVTDDNRVRSLAGRDLSSLGAWNLEVPRALGPLSLYERAFLIDKGGGVMAFGASGDRIWATDLRDEPPVGPPVVRNDEVWFLSHNGALQKRSLEDGSPIDRYDLGLLPSGGLVSVGSQIIVQAAPGTVRLLKSTEGSAGGAP